jgi:hypothetical protein
MRFYDEELTWEMILIDLTRMNFVSAEKHYADKLESFDNDLKKAKELLAYLDSITLLNFDIYRVRNKLEDLIRESA